MNLRRMLAIARKEFLHVIRDPRSLIAAIGIPVFMMFLYCYSLSLDVDHIPTVVMDYSRTSRSRDFVDRFRASGYFDIVRQVGSYREVQASLDGGEAVMAIVIPWDFANRLADVRGTAPVQVLLDGTDPTRGSIAQGYTMLIGQTFGAEELAERAAKLGRPKVRQPMMARPRIWYNPSLESRQTIIPALVAIIMAILAAFLTSLTFSREWENGTMELLISTPVKPHEVVLGKLIPYFVIGAFDSAVIIVAGWYVFGVVVKGSLLLLSLFVGVFLFGVLTFGMMISVVTRSQLVSSQVALMATYLPSILLSGFVFFIPAMPVPLKMLSHIVPARYFVEALRSVYLKAVDLHVLAPQLLFLLAFDVLVLVVASRRFVKKLDA